MENEKADHLPANLKIGAVLRACFSSMLSLLLIVTLFWGGCISCPRFFMFPASEKSCCDNAGKCERPAKNAPLKECKRMPLETQEFASLHAPAAATVFASVVLPAVPASNGYAYGFDPETLAYEHSPPDLNVLNSSFLI